MDFEDVGEVPRSDDRSQSRRILMYRNFSGSEKDRSSSSFLALGDVNPTGSFQALAALASTTQRGQFGRGGKRIA